MTTSVLFRFFTILFPFLLGDILSEIFNYDADLFLSSTFSQKKRQKKKYDETINSVLFLLLRFSREREREYNKHIIKWDKEKVMLFLFWCIICLFCVCMRSLQFISDTEQNKRKKRKRASLERKKGLLNHNSSVALERMHAVQKNSAFTHKCILLICVFCFPHSLAFRLCFFICCCCSFHFNFLFFFSSVQFTV